MSERIRTVRRPRRQVTQFVFPSRTAVDGGGGGGGGGGSSGSSLLKVDTSEKAKVRSKVSDLFGDWDPDQIQYDQYVKMLEDPQVNAAAQLRILARLSSGYEISPASDEAQDIEIAEFIEDQLEQMTGTFAGFYRRAAMATVRKVSIHEIVFRVIDGGYWRGKIGLQALKQKKYDPEAWRLKTDEFGNLTHLEQRFEGSWVPHNASYFAVWCHDHEGDFVAQSDLRTAYRYWKAKDHVDKFWNVYLERAASPTPYGKYPPGTSDPDQEKVLRFLREMNVLGAAVMPRDWEVDLIQTAGNGSAYKARIDYCDRMIARSMLLPLLMLDEGASGSYSLGKEHADTFKMVVEYIGDIFAEEIMHEQLIKRLVSINWHVDNYPRLKWKPLTGSHWKESVEAMCSLVDKGILNAQEPVVRERIGLPPREITGDDPGTDSASGNRGPGSGGAPPSNDPKKGAGVPGTDPEQYTAKKPAVELLQHAGKVEFAEIERGLDQVEERLQRNLAGIFEQMRDGLIATVRKRGIGRETRDLASVDRLRLAGIGDVRDALLAAFAHGLHQGASDAHGELDRGLDATGVHERPSVSGSMKANLEIAVPTGGEPDVDTIADIIRYWKGKVPIQKELLEYYSRQAFTIAGTYRDELLAKAQTVIRRGLVRGASMQQIEYELGNLFAPYVATGDVAADVTSAARLHNIARTNVAEAYNSGRMNFFAHEEVRTFIQAYEYSAVLDERTTDFCQSWHGVVLRADDPMLRTITPPNHYGCRAILIPVVRGEVFQITKRLPSYQPQSGFNLEAA